MSSGHDNTFRWSELDHAVIERKMNDLKAQITSEIETTDRLMPLPLHGNDFERRSYRLYRSFEVLQEERADEWVNRAYVLYCEQWIKQGGIKTADFVSAVWCDAIYPFLVDDILPFLRLAFAVDKRAITLTDRIYSRLPQGTEATRRVSSVNRIYSQVLKLWNEKKIPLEITALKSTASLPKTAPPNVAEKVGLLLAPATAYDRTKENTLKIRLKQDSADEPAEQELLEELERQHRLASQLVELQGPQLAIRVLGRTDVQIGDEIKEIRINVLVRAASAASTHATVAAPKPDLKAPVFAHSEAYDSITFEGQTYTLQPRQAAVVKLLHEALRKGHPGVPTMRILALPGCDGVDSVRDIFKSRLQLWGTLIINCEDHQEGRGFYRLHDSIQG